MLFLLLLLMFLIMLYKKIYGKELFQPIKSKYFEYNRKNKIKNYVRQVSRQPHNVQKIIFKESLSIAIVIFMMYLLATQAIFFTAVTSGSMYPTFEEYDLVLML